MKLFKVKRTIFDPYSPMDKLEISNDEYMIEICVNNDCCESFTSLELDYISSVFNGISHLELWIGDGDKHTINTSEFPWEIYTLVEQITLKDFDNKTIFLVNVDYEEGSMKQIVHVKVSNKNNLYMDVN